MTEATKHHLRVNLTDDRNTVVASKTWDVRVPIGGANAELERDKIAGKLVASFVAEYVYDCVSRGREFAVSSALSWTGIGDDYDTREEVEAATWTRRTHAGEPSAHGENACEHPRTLDLPVSDDYTERVQCKDCSWVSDDGHSNWRAPRVPVAQPSGEAA